jgi:Asp/Glu/hydantoin racemase
MMGAPLLMNPNGNATTTEAMLRIARRTLPELTGWTAPGGPPLITDMGLLAAAGAAVAAATIAPDCPGVIVSAFGDPGAEALRARLAVPVVGIGQTAAEVASVEGRSFAVATHTPGLTAGIDLLMRRYGGAAYRGCWLAEGDPAGFDDPAVLDAAMLDAVERAWGAGAEAVIIGGGPLGEVALRIAPDAPCPLIQPIPEAAARLRSLLG